MKKNLLAALALIMALTMIFSSCVNSLFGDSTTESSTNDSSESSSESNSESNSESAGGSESSSESESGSGGGTVENNKVTNKNDPLINMSNTLANGVQAYFSKVVNNQRTHFSMQNLEMTMTYARATGNKQLVESITNTKGASYIQNTMDVFVRMKSGNVYYASGSTKSAEVNLYRFGYYYYEGLFEFQNFTSDNYVLENPTSIDTKKNYSTKQEINFSVMDDGTRAFVITEPGNPASPDPWVSFAKGISLSPAENNSLVVVARALGDTTGATVFVDLGEGYKQAYTTSFNFINDGEYHTYYISLSSIPGYSAASILKGIRFDPNGSVGSGLAIESITVGNANDVPAALSINRHFHVYSDKMHHAIQFAVTERTENIAEVGMLTEISADTVSKLIVVTSDDKTYSSLDAGFSWDDVVAVGFDINGAGIFGFILPADEIAGKITVELKDGVYVIEQTRIPSVDGVDGVIIPSINTTELDKNGNYIHADGVTNNGNDFYIGQRVYTDESHNFDEFLKETGFERHPLSSKYVNIASTSNNASFGGYDAMRGIYYFNIETPVGGFYTPYNAPQKNYKIDFTLRTDVDRDIYIMTTGSAGLLECAVLMDEDDLLLPVPIEVIKNFSEATGERNLYNISDPTFSEAIFCLSLDTGAKYSYTIINLYQNWGNYPLKQLSQIPFHCPYYHLSTGVTETNCILPWFGTPHVGKSFSSTLPDFRAMSAPFWGSQPQHNSSGAHTWLKYTDTEGKTYSVESIVNTITSYGPTYAEVVWDNISDDGKIRVTYTHMEMPQLDENRTYYTMEYEFLEDLTIENFKNNFQFYKAGDNNSVGTYKKIGYLNADNEYAVVDANQDASLSPEYVLGDECPYFSFFMMPDWHRENTSAEGYSNVAFLIYNSDFTIGGESYTPTFLIQNPKDYVAVTLDEEGTIEFKKGDKITINAILLPWGSQELEDDPANRLNKPQANGYSEYTYSSVLPDGTLYMDKNARDVRENTLLDPLKATSETDEILDSPFLPKIKSRDGKSATFTLSGGENNVAVRVYGFNMLTAPKIEEYKDGQWVEYVVSSKNNPDVNGYYHYYDGYMVYYDEDGTYSYSFVTTMTGDQTRTFRVTADTEFKGWPAERLPEGNQDLLSIYTDHEEYYKLILAANQMYGSPVLRGDDGEAPYVSVYMKYEAPESYSLLHTAGEKEKHTGQYLVIKYRIPSSNVENSGRFEFWTSTTTTDPREAGYYAHFPTADGEWHVDIIDLSKAKGLKSYVAADDGLYYAQLLRFDVFNEKLNNLDTHVDIAYIGIDHDLMTIAALETDQSINFTFYSGEDVFEFDPATGGPKVETYIDPSSGYTESPEKFGAYIDDVNGLKLNAPSGSTFEDIKFISGCTVNKNIILTIKGWCAVEGGVEKYVYSVDGGKTWLDCGGAFGIGHANILKSAGKFAGGEGYTFKDADATMINGAFQGSGLYIDLSNFEGKNVDVIFAAVPKANTSTLALLYYFEDITCSAPALFDESSIYTEVSLAFGSQVDSINGVNNAKTASSATSFGIYNNLSVNENGQLILKGWSIVDGGVTKYVWTADGGKTWHDCGGQTYGGNDGMIRSAQNKTNYTFPDPTASKTNAAFQGAGITIDLSSYAGHEGTLDIYVCAVPTNAPDQVVPLYLLSGVSTQTAQ